MVKHIVSFVLLCSLLFGFTGFASASANISPNSQTIYGPSALAKWKLTWSTGSNPRIIRFNRDTGEGYRVINHSTRSGSMDWQHRYVNSTPPVSYTIGLMVHDFSEPPLVTGADTATLVHR